MKCTKCKENKDPTNFPMKAGKRNTICKECKNAAQRAWYKANPEIQKKHVRKRSKEWVSFLRNYIWSVKLSNPCKCGEQHPICLDFHHRDRRNKRIEVSLLVSRGCSLENLRKEIEKCDVLCRNCHAIYHWLEYESL